MAKKLTFVLGLGAGYVLGARAGRERYEQIAGKVRQVARNPKVQEKAEAAQNLAKEKAAEAGSAVTAKVQDVAGGSSGSSGTADSGAPGGLGGGLA